MVPVLLKEGTVEFNELIGEPVAIQEDTNLANDDDANERIQIVEYKPDETKYARIFDVGNGEWCFYDLIDRRNLIIFPEKVAKRLQDQEYLNEKMMENILTPNKLTLNLYGPNFVIVRKWKATDGTTHHIIVSGVYTHIQNCIKECEKRNNSLPPDAEKEFSIRDITCNVRKI